MCSTLINTITGSHQLDCEVTCRMKEFVSQTSDSRQSWSLQHWAIWLMFNWSSWQIRLGGVRRYEGAYLRCSAPLPVTAAAPPPLHPAGRALPYLRRRTPSSHRRCSPAGRRVRQLVRKRSRRQTPSRWARILLLLRPSVFTHVSKVQQFELLPWSSCRGGGCLLQRAHILLQLLICSYYLSVGDIWEALTDFVENLMDHWKTWRVGESWRELERVTPSGLTQSYCWDNYMTKETRWISCLSQSIIQQPRSCSVSYLICLRDDLFHCRPFWEL